MTKKMFGIVALGAMMMIGANCGGPTTPPDGGDGGCEPAKADSTCPPDGGDGGQLDFTATVKAFAPAEGLVGDFTIVVDEGGGCAEWYDGLYAFGECRGATECDITFSKSRSSDEVYQYYYSHDFLRTRRLCVYFRPPNSLYVDKNIAFTANGEVKEVRWSEGEGGIDPGGRTYRGTIGTFTNVRAGVRSDGKIGLSGVTCMPALTITRFEGTCSDGSTMKGTVATDLSTLHIEVWANGVMTASDDAYLVQ